MPDQSCKSTVPNNLISPSTHVISQNESLSKGDQSWMNEQTNQIRSVGSFQFDGPNDFDANGTNVQNIAGTLADPAPNQLKTDKPETANEQNHITQNSFEGLSIKEEEELKDHVVAEIPAFEPNYTPQEELQEHAIKMENDDNPMSDILDELIAALDRSRSSSLSTLSSLEEFDKVSDTPAWKCCFQEPTMKTEEMEVFTSPEQTGDATGRTGQLATQIQNGASNSIAIGQNLSFVKGSQDQLMVEHCGEISSSAPIEQNPVLVEDPQNKPMEVEHESEINNPIGQNLALVEDTQDKPMRPEHRVETSNLIGQTLVLAENHQDQLMAEYHEEIILPADTCDREVLPGPSPGPIEGNYIANPATDEQVLRPTDAPRVPSAQKEENRTEASNSGEVILAKIPPELLEAYNNLFLMWDSKPPNIDIKNIGTALKQTETLVVIAQLYESESPSFFRMCLNNSILQFGRDVYQAILEEPHRWLQLSLQLESKPIFQESIIHLVGCWPSYWATAQESDLPEYVFDLCQQKLTELKNKKKDIDEKLFCQTITLRNPDSKLLVDFSDKATFDTYFVVNGWREWFVSKISEAKRNRVKDCVDAKAYQTMAKGGETYLPLSSMVTALENYQQDEHRSMLEKQITRESIKEDLKLLKDYAQKTVQPLCKNYSLLSIEEFGITHFTCTKVETHEFPWLLNAGSQGGN